MTTVEIEKIDQIPEDLRLLYLNSLLEAQELHVERLVEKGTPFLIRAQGHVAGYVVTHKGCLVELFFKKNYFCLLPKNFDLILHQSNSSSALVKSFDSQMIFACASRVSKVKTTGLLFRELVNKKFLEKNEIKIRPGKTKDIHSILAMHDSFFENEDEIMSYLNQSGLFLYFRAEELQGVGIMKKIIPSQNAFDLGMVVSPNSRRSGLGSYIVSHIKALCLSKGHTPVCGCSADNLASKKSLERAGFVTRYSLLKFSYNLSS